MEFYIYNNQGQAKAHIQRVNNAIGYPNGATKTDTYCDFIESFEDGKFRVIKDSVTEKFTVGSHTGVGNIASDLVHIKDNKDKVIEDLEKYIKDRRSGKIPKK